jgi:6,7-dimethyl-8-ribityllumazine synthase
MAKNYRSEADSDAPDLDGAGMRIAIVCGRFNDLITSRMVGGTSDRLRELGVADEDVTLVWVPGAFEIPIVAKQLAASGEVDAVIGLGAVIRGETGHYDFVAGECARGIQEAQLETGVPIIFGVLTTNDLDQAMVRSDPEGDDKGGEAASTAIEMIGLLQSLPGSA